MEAHYRTREEMKSMLVKALEQERANLRQEGYDIGEQKGIEKGIVAQRQTLLRLLHWKFTLTDETLAAYGQQLAQIHQLEQLLHLLDRLLDSNNLADFDVALRPYLPTPELQQ